jgi:hypothetical protein
VLLAAGTVPAYVLLGNGHVGRLLAVGVVAAGVTGILVFGTAARDPRPTAVALAATLGYAVFAFGLVALAARELFDAGSTRTAFVLASAVPALWGGALALAASGIGDSESIGATLLRSAAVTLGYLPVLWWFGRGLGLRRLARDGIVARPLTA